MQDTVGVDLKMLDDSELIALLRDTQDEFETHGESNELNSLLREFARELLKRRVVEKVEFVRVLEASRPE